MSLSTHLLDLSLGRPATNVAVSLARWAETDWAPVHQARTDADGRIHSLVPEGELLDPGTFRMRFDTAAYFTVQGRSSLYPFIDIVFQLEDAQAHYHLPVLLTAHGYTTYRGS